MVAVLERYRVEGTPAALAEGAFEAAAWEIAAALRWTRRATEGWLALAEEVTGRLPALHIALLAGEIDVPRARVFVSELSAVDDPVARGIVDRLLPVAAGLTTGQLGARIRKLVTTVDPEQAQARYEIGVAGRRVECQMASDGTATVSGWGLPADRAASASERVDALAKAAKCAGDPRSMDQLRADTFLSLLNGDYDGPAPVYRRGVVELTVPLATLLGLSDGPGELAGWGPVVADVARQVADAQRETATWRFSVLDAEGRLVQHGITRRRPVAADEATVRVRDRRCVFPGCRVPASRCDIDHRRRYADGGLSTVENLEPLCRRHHRAKDGGGWSLFHLGDSHYLWTSPLGQSYLVSPEPLQPP